MTLVRDVRVSVGDTVRWRTSFCQCSDLAFFFSRIDFDFILLYS